MDKKKTKHASAKHPQSLSKEVESVKSLLKKIELSQNDAKLAAEIEQMQLSDQEAEILAAHIQRLLQKNLQ